MSGHTKGVGVRILRILRGGVEEIREPEQKLGAILVSDCGGISLQHDPGDPEIPFAVKHPLGHGMHLFHISNRLEEVPRMPKSRKRKHRSGKTHPVSNHHRANEAVLAAMANLVSLPISLAEEEYKPFQGLTFPPGMEEAAEKATAAMRSFILTYVAGGIEVYTASVMMIGQTLLTASTLFGDEEQIEHLPNVGDLPQVMGELARREVVPLPFYRDGAQWVEPVNFAEAEKMAKAMLQEEE